MNVTSIAGQMPLPHEATYSATKFGLRGFAAGLREDVEPNGIGVSVVCPGFISDAGLFADSGVKLPLNLVNRVPEDALSNRNTYIRAYFDKAGTLSGFDKIVYGEVELAHRYEYHPGGALKLARITMLDEDPVMLTFDESGVAIATL